MFFEENNKADCRLPRDSMEVVDTDRKAEDNRQEITQKCSHCYFSHRIKLYVCVIDSACVYS